MAMDGEISMEEANQRRQETTLSTRATNGSMSSANNISKFTIHRILEDPGIEIILMKGEFCFE